MDDEQIILDLIRKVSFLKKENEDLKRVQQLAKLAMSKVGVPTYFEDGDDVDNLSFIEMVGILCDMYKLSEAKQRQKNLYPREEKTK